MPLRSYLRYQQRSSLGIIASPNCPALILSHNQVISAALQEVLVHHLKTGMVLHRLTLPEQHSPSAVTRLALHPRDRALLAVGYAHGLIAMWSLHDAATPRVQCVFNGHNGAITCLSFSVDGSLLYSGAADARICCWQLLSERGLYALVGHKDAVTALALVQLPGRPGAMLASASKDATVKLWDCLTQHCCQTLVASKSEVWAIAVDPQARFLLAGGAEDVVRVYRMHSSPEPMAKPSTPAAAEDQSEDVCEQFGALPRQSSKRVASIVFSADGLMVAVQSTDRTLQLLSLRTEHDAVKRAKKRRKRNAEAAEASSEHEADVNDFFAPISNLRLESKIAGVNFAPPLAHERSSGSSPRAHRALLTLADNSLRLYELHREAEGEHQLLRVLDQGHRAPIRALSFNRARTQVLTAGAGQIKAWDVHTGQCVRSLECGEALCLLTVPGDRHVCVGTKSGDIEWFDLASARRLGCVRAHEGSVLCCDLRRDGRGFVTGGADKKVHDFDFELVEEEAEATGSGPRARVLSIALSRSLQLSDEVLCVRHSPSGSHLAVGLLDSTVRVFHADTLAFALSLYGHRLPVLDLDFSSDGQLLVTGSADKNIKVWGATFGDCHASIFAHTDSVTRCRFLPGTHLVATASKDGVLKLFDADSRELVQELHGHTNELWALDVAGADVAGLDQDPDAPQHGELLVTAGNDRSVRIWQATNEPLFPEEEREMRLDALFDNNAAQVNHKNGVGAAPGSGVSAFQLESDAVVATRASESTLKASERLIDAIVLATAEEKRIVAHRQAHEAQVMLASSAPDRSKRGVQFLVDEAKRKEAQAKMQQAGAQFVANPLLAGRKPLMHVMHALHSIPSSDLLDCMLALPFAVALQLLEALLKALRQAESVELCIECSVTLLSLHEARIVSHSLLQAQLQEMRSLSRAYLRQAKQEYGVNCQALHTFVHANA